MMQKNSYTYNKKTSNWFCKLENATLFLLDEHRFKMKKIVIILLWAEIFLNSLSSILVGTISFRYIISPTISRNKLTQVLCICRTDKRVHFTCQRHKKVFLFKNEDVDHKSRINTCIL